ncbi:MAG: Sialic acid TRAP transporter permease protein SiaT [Smithella sp. PtaU1.Bin162]|nr:MAG: Sialic acid TRAP transporter permease protein SiaT [Smithella sp. PtaU1.Bin162]
METALLFVIFAILSCLNVPIAISLAAAAIIILATTTDFTLYMTAQRMFASLLSTTLLAVPSFVFAGVVMTHGGISKYLIAAIRAWTGHIQGGLAIVTIIACAIFAAVSGSSAATAAAIGAIMLPAMIENGYSKRYAMGLVAASGTLGILIPPSVPMVIFGFIAEYSIGELFAAGLIPGIIMAGVLIVSAIIYARKQNMKMMDKATRSERWRASFKALPGAFLPVFILGSIYSGLATPTEAAVLSVFYTLLVSIFVYREMKWALVRKILVESVNISAMIYLIISAAMVFSLFLTVKQIPQQILQLTAATHINKWMFFLVTQLMFFIMGTFLEAASITLITLPILLPVIQALDIPLVQFCVVMTVNMELAMITPPVGMNLFVVAAMSGEKLEEVVKGVWPFILIMISILIIFVLWPGVSTWLPSKMRL